MAPEPVEKPWVVEYVDAYRLKATDLLAFLKKKFGEEFDKSHFNIRVRLLCYLSLG